MFQYWDSSEGKYLIDWNLWLDYKSCLFSSYPVNRDHTRVEFSISSPRQALNCADYYYNTNWSIIFEVYKINKMFYIGFSEKDHVGDLGEKICFISSSKNLFNHGSCEFAYFRNSYWQIDYFHKCQRKDNETNWHKLGF